MSAETNTTTLNDIVYSYVIEQTFLDYQYDSLVLTPLARPFSLVGKPSNVLQLPRITSNMTVNDNGASTDNEFDATEATALSNTAVSTENVQVTVGEYGFQATVTDNVSEDSISGVDFMSMLMMYAARVLATAVETDAVGNFPNLSQSVGLSGATVTLAQIFAASDGVRTRGTHAPDGLAWVFDDATWADLRDLSVSTNVSQAVFMNAADRFTNIGPTADRGLVRGQVGYVLGWPAYSSGLTPTANTAVDVVSAVITPSSPANDGMATYGYVEKRPFRAETIRVPGLRGTQIDFTRRCAVGEIQDGSGTKIVTQA